MKRIKGSLTIGSRSPSPAPKPSQSINAEDTPFTAFILGRLNDQQLRLFAMTFAEHVKSDRHAKVIDFAKVYQWQVYERYDNAVRQVKNIFREDELVIENLLTFL